MSPEWGLVAVAAIGMVGSWVSVAFYAGRITGRIDAPQSDSLTRHANNIERFRGIEGRLGEIESSIRNLGFGGPWKPR